MSETILIPAPAETLSEGGIAWYEVRLLPDSRSVQLVGFDNGGGEVSTAEVTGVSDYELSALISEQEVRLAIALAVKQVDSGELQVSGTIAGSEFAYSGRPGADEGLRIEAQPSLDAERRQVLDRWRRLGGSLNVLSQAMLVRTAQLRSASWPSSACALLAAEIAFEGSGAAGQADIVHAFELLGSYVEHCT